MRTSREIGKRIESRLQAVGYWKNGRPDVSRFCQERGYLPQYIYAWLKGRVPQFENLIRLGADLEVAPAWLLFGDNGMDGWVGAEIRQLIRPNGDSAREAARLGAQSGRSDDSPPPEGPRDRAARGDGRPARGRRGVRYRDGL